MAEQAKPTISNFEKAVRRVAAPVLVLAALSVPVNAQSYRNNDPFQPNREQKPGKADPLIGVGSAIIAGLVLWSLTKDVHRCKERDATGYCVKHN